MALTKIGSIGINTGIAFAGVTTITTLNSSDVVLSVGGTVNFVSDISIGGTVSIGGTLTYEDVTNIDSVGLITARNGVVVGSGITLSKDGDIFATGISTVNGVLVGSGVTLSKDGDIFATGITTVGKTVFLSGQNPNIRFDDSDTTNNGEITLDNTQLRIEVDEDDSTSSSAIKFRIDGSDQVSINSDGDVTFKDKIVHAGDTDTAIRFPAADQISFETGGTQHMIIGTGGAISITDTIQHTGDTNTKIRFPENDHISFETAGVERIRIDNGGKLLIGLDDRRMFGASVTSKLQIEGTTATGTDTASLSITNNQDSNGAPSVRLAKTRGTSVGSNTSVADGDNLGQIVFYGADGTDIYNATALIGAKVNGTVGTDTIPTDIVFETSTTTGSSRQERLTIKSNGKILIGSNTSRNIGGPSALGHFQIEGTTGNTSSVSLINNQNNSGGIAVLRFAKTRGTSDGAVTTVADGDSLGGITFTGADGTDLLNSTAQIRAIVNGTVAGNTIPTDLIFETSATDGDSISEKLRIFSSGQVGINTSGEVGAPNNVKLAVDGEMSLRYTSKGDGQFTSMATYGKSVNMTTSALDVLRFHSFGSGAVEITVFRRDSASPSGSQVTKLYIAFQGSGNNITNATLVQEDKVTRGSIHNFTYSISENNTYATLTATGNNNGGEDQTLIFYIVHAGGNNRTITVL